VKLSAMLIAALLYSTPTLALMNIYECRNAAEFREISLTQDKGTEQTQRYIDRDLTHLWLDKSDRSEADEPQEYYGAMGEDHHRLRMFLTHVSKDKTLPGKYLVQGYRQREGQQIPFTGHITINHIHVYESPALGVDGEMADRVVEQALLMADYQFDEDKNVPDSGRFTGSAAASFYVDKKNIIRPDTYIPSDSYANNQFMGTWTPYHGETAVTASWGLWRVPCAGDLDIGAGEFSVNEKYKKNGW
jgi:hypothetical protein